MLHGDVVGDNCFSTLLQMQCGHCPQKAEIEIMYLLIFRNILLYVEFNLDLTFTFSTKVVWYVFWSTWNRYLSWHSIWLGHFGKGAFTNFDGRIPNCTDWDIFGTGELPANVRGSGGKDQLLVWQLKYERELLPPNPGFLLFTDTCGEKHKLPIWLLKSTQFVQMPSQDFFYGDFEAVELFTLLSSLIWMKNNKFGQHI